MSGNNTIVADLSQTLNLIQQGKLLIIAGDHNLLRRLPAGNWIGGSIPYFMTYEGGVFNRNKLLVTDFSPFVEEFKIRVYSQDDIPNIPENYYDNGFNYILIPGMSEALKTFAIKAERILDFFYGPLVGWVTGTRLDIQDPEFPVVIDGQSHTEYTDAAVVLHAKLPDKYRARIEIVNIFEPGDGDTIMFMDDSFEIYECYVNGERVVFADYLKSKNIDKSHPLVADYNGAYINISIKDITDIFVETFAPVRRGVRYKFARRLGDYEKEFMVKIPVYQPEVVASCNCIYNFIYGKLENKKLPYVGPFTFGEIGYLLLNQTMVNLHLIER